MRDRFAERVGIHTQRLELAVHETNVEAERASQVRHDGIGEGGEYDFRAGLEIERAEDERQAGAPGRNRHRGGHSDELGKRSLEALDADAFPKIASGQARDRAQPALRRQVDALSGDGHPCSLPFRYAAGRIGASEEPDRGPVDCIASPLSSGPGLYMSVNRPSCRSVRLLRVLPRPRTDACRCAIRAAPAGATRSRPQRRSCPRNPRARAPRRSDIARKSV